MLLTQIFNIVFVSLSVLWVDMTKHTAVNSVLKRFVLVQSRFQSDFLIIFLKNVSRRQEHKRRIIFEQCMVFWLNSESEFP